jgi:hypothetical protein
MVGVLPGLCRSQPGIRDEECAMANSAVKMVPKKGETVFAREYWTGDSRDGALVNGEGYHYYRMSAEGLIEEAFETYENEDGSEVVAPLPEMENVHWMNDLGYEDWDVLDMIKEDEFLRIKELNSKD